MQRYRSTAALVLGVLALTACGSTVQVRGTGTTGALPDGELTVDAGTQAGRPGMVDGPSTVAGGPSAVPGGGLTAPTTAGPTTSGPSVGPGPSGPMGTAVGVNATTIRIGILTAQGFSSAAKNLGISADIGDTRAQAEAMVNYLNAHGGIAGRRILPVYYDVNVARQSTDPQGEMQAACAALTQDNHIYALATAVAFGDEGFYSCLRKAGVIASQAGEHFDAQFFEQFANHFYMPAEINMTRVLSDNIDALAAAGFFHGWDHATGRPGALPVKVGFIRQDNPSDLRVRDQGVKPALARHGLTLTDEQAVSGSLDQMAAQYQSAVLRFKAAGITHVLFPFLTPLVFMEASQQQQYFPRYGLNSRNSPGALLQGNAPSQQQRGAMGMGWQQYNDVDSARDPGPPSARAKLCLELLQKAGQNTSVRATALIGLWYCDAIFFLRDALVKAPSFLPAGFRAGAESLTSVGAASTFRSSFGPGLLHDGARAYRLFAFDDACTCYRYTSGVRAT